MKKNNNIQHLEIDKIVNIIDTSMINSANASIPVTSHKITKPPVPWWNDDIKMSIQERKRAERQMKREFSIENKIIYNRAKMMWSRNEARKQSWIQCIITAIDQYTNVSYIWKKS